VSTECKPADAASGRCWLEKGVQFFYVHSDPFLRLGLNGIKKSLGR
jgi:hypothetical protein